MKSKIKENSGISTRHKPHVIGKASTSGITLIALIVTIVVLIILAVISMNLLMNGNIIGRAQQASEIQAKAAELERLELIKSVVALDNKGKVTVDDYIEEAIKEGVTTEDTVEDNGDESKNIVTDNGYNVNIAPDPDNENNVIITIDGEGTGNKLLPKITKLIVTEKDETTATITIEVRRAEGATYKYYCKAEGEEYGEPFYTGTDLSKDKTELELDDKEYTIKVEATNQHGTTYKEQKIGEKDTIAAEPKLTTGMTPVKWNGTGWERTTENDPEWYSYTKADKKWANVVLGDAQWTGEGDKILNEDEPYSQLVWIPRYAYKITSMYHYSETDKAGNIKVKFVNNTTNTDSNGETWSEDYPTVTNEGTATGRMENYVVHPAFNFGTDKLTGIWVGKYESSFVGTGTTDKSGQSNDPTKTMMIKAGVASWRNITINNIYNVCLNMNKSGNVYQLNTSDSVVDPHLMKNDEWGAVAYLSKSKYGKYNEEVMFNFRNDYITGNEYSIANVQDASTTGNVYGVYDMSGGADEYVAAYLDNKNSNIKMFGASLQTAAESVENKKYVNVYRSASSNGTSDRTIDYEYANPRNANATEDYKHYGDAVWETSSTYSSSSGSWYNDNSYFAFSDNTFFSRGGSCTDISGTGMFTLGCYWGLGHSYVGFRVVVPVL